MARAEPAGGDVLEAGSGRGAASAGSPPTVLAVVVTEEAGAGLDACLGGLADQDYPDLRVLVVDCSQGSDPTDRVRRIVDRAFVRRVGGASGFAAAANEALAVAERATFLLVCRDDVVLDPPATRLLVEEAYRSNAGMVGPKVVDAESPSVLLEVGLTTDRFGAPHTGIEPGEIDHEQHDGVRDVFYVSDAAMLVRADLFRELGGFEPAASPGAEDLDLCWRARLAGARVLVAPDARARRSTGVAAAASRRNVVAVARNRVRAVLTCYSRFTLLRVVPIGLVVALGATIVSVLLQRRGRGRAALGAWWWNLRRLGEIRRARRRAQGMRRVDDRELRALQVRGSALARHFLTEHLHTEERWRSVSRAGRMAVDSASTSLRGPVGLAAATLVVLFGLGSRDLVVGTVPAVGSFARWPGIMELLEAYGSGWRYTGMGSTAAAPPAFAVMAAMGTPLLGAMGLARTLLVIGAFPVGAIGAYRVARPMMGSPGPAAVAGLAYAITPVPRNAVATGRLGPLVVFALGPFLVALLLRVAGGDGAGRARALVGLITLTAVTTAFLPLAPLFGAAAALAFLLVTPLVGGGAVALRMLAAASAAAAGALVLLFPWSTDLLGGDLPAAGFAYRPDLSLADALRFHSGPHGAGWAGWGLLASASLALALGTGTRLAWATRAWGMAAVGFALAWLPGRLALGEPVLLTDAPLALAALGVALAVGLGAAALVEELPRFRFGWRQPVVAVAVVGALLGVLSFAADAVDGSWRAPTSDWDRALSWMRAEREEGGFRVLWVGDPLVLPPDPALAGDEVGWVLTRDGPGAGEELWRAPETSADREVGAAVELTLERRTNRLGHLLAPMGVRYVALPERAAPSAGVRADAPVGLDTALDDQVDLLRLTGPSGIALYENAAWAATRAALDAQAADELPVDSPDPLQAALRTELADAAAVTGPVRGSSEIDNPGAVLWSEAYHDDWSARAGGEELAHERAFGLSNGYRLPEPGSVSITYAGQRSRYLVLFVQGALWAVLAFAWWMTRYRGEREGVA